MKKQKAFTLVELMITMAIIAILATAGIQAYTGYVKKGRDTARAQIAQNLNSSVMAYAASNGGEPPAGPDEFANFLSSAGETFGGGSISVANGTLVQDPVGGKEVCLDAAGTPNQPCRFDYTAYADGTYAISYGVEHESSKEGNFYKTTQSVLADNDTNGTLVKDKYGVYIGSAPFIGSTPTTSNTAPNSGVDVGYVPIGGDVNNPIAMVDVVLKKKRIDAPTVSSGGGGSGGDVNVPERGACTQSSQCLSGLECQLNICVPIDPCAPEYFSGNITMTHYDTQITDYGWGDSGAVFYNIVGTDGNGRPASYIESIGMVSGGVECDPWQMQCSFNSGGPTSVTISIKMGLDACWEHSDIIEATFQI